MAEPSKHNQKDDGTPAKNNKRYQKGDKEKMTRMYQNRNMNYQQIADSFERKPYAVKVQIKRETGEWTGGKSSGIDTKAFFNFN